MNIPGSKSELLRWFPEIELIEGSLQRKTLGVFLEHCPRYFWVAPASSSGNYHPEDHCGRYGLVLHTKRAFTVFEGLAESFRRQGLVDGWEVNCGRAAILLHDLLKYGHPPGDEDGERRRHTVSNHDVLAADLLREESDFPDEVVDCVESHNGPWGEGKSPENPLEELHHVADMTASRPNIQDIAVYKPCEELQERFPELKTCDL